MRLWADRQALVPFQLNREAFDPAGLNKTVQRDAVNSVSAELPRPALVLPGQQELDSD